MPGRLHARLCHGFLVLLTSRLLSVNRTVSGRFHHVLKRRTILLRFFLLFHFLNVYNVLILKTFFLFTLLSFRVVRYSDL